MPDPPFLDYDAKGIAELLAQESLAVPMYQRAYSWRSKAGKDADEDNDDSRAQVEEFWQDLAQGYRQGQPYFLGTVVLSAEGAPHGRKAVIDGQQRLATTCLLMAAIRDAYRDRDEVQYADSIHSDFVAKFDRNVGTDQPKLILSSDDRDYFDHVVVRRGLLEPRNESQRLLRDAWVRLQSEIGAFCERSGMSWKTELDKLSTYLQRSAQVIAISVPTEADAFLIFETLNDRGADLTVADLLKNFLFGSAQGRLDEVRDLWVRTLTSLDIPKVGNRRFNLFARHYMSSRRGPVRERDLYGSIKREVSNPPSAVQFATDLQRNARLYSGLISVDSDIWGDFTEAGRQAAEVLADLSLEQSRPLLLAALDTLDKSQAEELLQSMVSWSIRGLASGTLGGGAAEAAFCAVAQQIRSKRVTTARAVLAEPSFSDLVPSDAEFEQDFTVWRVLKGSLARYILRTLELQERGEREPELVVNPDVAEVNLEHIFPRSPRPGEWAHLGEEDQRLWVHRLGNMALLKKGENGRIGNKAWSVKKPILMRSVLRLTQQAGAQATWDKLAIAERQKYMAKLAVVAWPRSHR